MGSTPAQTLLLLGSMLLTTSVCSSQHLNSIERNGVFFSGLPRPDSELNAITEQDTPRNTPRRAGLENKKLGGTNRQLTGTTPFDFRFNSAKPDNRFTFLRTTPRPDIATITTTTRAPTFITQRQTTNRVTTARPTLAPATTRVQGNAKVTNGPTTPQGTLSFSFRRASLTTGGNQSPPEILKASAPSVEDISTPSEVTQGTPRQLSTVNGRTPPALPTTFHGRVELGSQGFLAPTRETASPVASSTLGATRNTQANPRQLSTVNGRTPTVLPTTFQGRVEIGSQGSFAPTRETTSPAASSTLGATRNTQGSPRQPSTVNGRTPPSLPTPFQGRVELGSQGSLAPTRETAPPAFSPTLGATRNTQGSQRPPSTPAATASPAARPFTVITRNTLGSQRPPSTSRATAPPAPRSSTVTTRNTQGERTTRIVTESAPALGLTFTRIAPTNQGSRSPPGIITERRIATRPTATPSSFTRATQRLPTTRTTLPTVRSITITGSDNQETQQTPLRFAFCDKVLCDRSCRQRFGAKLNSSDCLNNACKCEVDEGCKPEACAARCRDTSNNLRSAVCEDGVCRCIIRERCTSALCNEQCRRAHVGKELLGASCQGDACQCAIKKPCDIEDCRRNCQKAQGNRLFGAECSDQDICRCLHT